MPDNLINYEKKSVVAYYRGQDKLSLAEQAILEIVRKKNLEKMIDIGVGAGRTTAFFAKAFKQYVGIDYSGSMIDAARNRFEGFEGCNFYHCDARDMSAFENGSFDFVLFSFNGIDCVCYDDRQKILSEIKRIGKPNSYFAFSTHNLYSLNVLFSFQFPKNPFKYLKEFKRYQGVRKHNPKKENILKHDFYPMIDGDIDFSAEYLYYKPDKQITELERHGFEEISVISIKTGKTIQPDVNWSDVNEPWLYFLCKNSEQ